MKEQNVQTLDRAMNIIELLSTVPQGMGVTEIGSRLDLHKSTVHRLITSLVRRGYIEKGPHSGHYKIGLKFLEISSLFVHQLELKTEAAPFMRRLAEQTGQVTHLAILDGTDVVYIDKIDVVQSLRLYSQIGKRIPVHCSALGKILLSGLSENQTQQIVEQIGYEAYTENTIRDRARFLAELKKTRDRGWATDNEEHEKGIRCIAAPIKDFTGRVIAAISVSGQKNAIHPDQDEQTSRWVVTTAKAISKSMGYIL